MQKKEIWKFVIQTAISILSAIATALGVTSCMLLRKREMLHLSHIPIYTFTFTLLISAEGGRLHVLSF